MYIGFSTSQETLWNFRKERQKPGKIDAVGIRKWQLPFTSYKNRKWRCGPIVGFRDSLGHSWKRTQTTQTRAYRPQQLVAVAPFSRDLLPQPLWSCLKSALNQKQRPSGCGSSSRALASESDALLRRRRVCVVCVYSACIQKQGKTVVLMRKEINDWTRFY